jgi:hypothetical protein
MIVYQDYEWQTAYIEGMMKYDAENSQTLFLAVMNAMHALWDESCEFLEAVFVEKKLKNVIDEFFDVAHTLGRLIVVMVAIVSSCKIKRLVLKIPMILGWNTAKKHAVRYIETGCVRSKRNCEEKNHNCNGKYSDFGYRR